MAYTKTNLPAKGTFIAVELMILTKTCGSTLTGYFAGADDEFLYLSEVPNPLNRDSKVGWGLITNISDASPNNGICIYI